MKIIIKQKIYNQLFYINHKLSMRVNSQRNINSPIKATLDQNQLFFNSAGIRKRKIFYNVEYTAEEKQWIKNVRRELKNKNNIYIEEDQTLLRYYYSSNLDMQNCIVKLVRYYEWFHNKQIQTVSKETEQILRDGFIYSFAKGKQGRPYVVMNLACLDLSKHSVVNYYQALNVVNNRIIKDDFVPGYVETYDYVLDLEERFLTLPLTSLGSIIKIIADVYSMRLERLKIVNCTTASKWIYTKVESWLSEETAKKVQLHTAQEVNQGVLKELFDQNLIQIKYGGTHQNIDHKLKKTQIEESQVINFLDETEYLSVEQNQQFFSRHEGMVCCVNDACTIY